MSREYSENVRVQNSAGNLLQNVLGWEVVLAYNSEKPVSYTHLETVLGENRKAGML